MNDASLDPQYLRYVIDSLVTRRMDGRNISSLPAGLSGIYEELFSPGVPAAVRKRTIKIFLCIALFPDGVSLDRLADILGYTVADLRSFIEQNSRYITLNQDGDYALYHARLTAYCLQRLSAAECLNVNDDILHFLLARPEDNWTIRRIGYHLALKQDAKRLFHHLDVRSESKNESWWLRDLDNALDLVAVKEEVETDYTRLCQLLRTVFDYKLITKGAYVIVRHAHQVDWNALEDFLDTTRFQYELAFEFSMHPDRLPAGWWEMVGDEDHQLSYTFSYAWKYLAIADSGLSFIAGAESLIGKCSPYQRIILVMIWGGRSLKFGPQNWFESMRHRLGEWPYLLEELAMWEQAVADQASIEFQERFNAIRIRMPKHLHYVFDHYWWLIEDYRVLTRDAYELGGLECCWEVAYWIYKNPYWEIGKIANTIVLEKIRNTRLRPRALEWIKDVWEREELYVMGELVFYIGRFPELREQFQSFCRQLCCAGSGPLRGSFVGDLVGYLESADDEFRELAVRELIPALADHASDIWETQEMIRLLNAVKDDQSSEWLKELMDRHFLLSRMPDALTMNYNEVWREAEKILFGRESE